MGQQDRETSDYELGVAVVSILISILISVGFGVYSIWHSGWASVLIAVSFTVCLGAAIRIGGEDGFIPRVGRWVLGRH